MPRTDGRPKTDAVCKECGGEYYAKYLCQKHYFKSRRTTTRQLIPEGAECHCGKPVRAKGLCAYHYNQSKGYVSAPKTAVPKDKVVGYRAAHIRVSNAKGKASTYQCVCGKPAREWALDPQAVHTYEDEQGRVWSLNVDDYKAMCSSCHRKLDKQPDEWYIDLWLEGKV